LVLAAMVKKIADPLSDKKAKTAKGRRFLKNRAPKVHENPKTAIFLKGVSTDEAVKGLLLDLCNLKKPRGLHFTRRNQMTHPFENPKDIEYLTMKNDCSLFAFGSKSKKRPFRLLMGRCFDHSILDMQEFAVSGYKPVSKFSKVVKQSFGSDPLVIFQGSGFDQDDALKKVKNLLLDFFRAPPDDTIALSALEHVVVFSVLDPPRAFGTEEPPKVVNMRHYRIELKKSGTKIPRVELVEIGPACDLKLDRSRWSDPAVFKAACKRPKEVTPKKVKNVSTDALGNTRGRLRIEPQNFNKINSVHGGGGAYAKKAAVKRKSG